MPRCLFSGPREGGLVCPVSPSGSRPGRIWEDPGFWELLVYGNPPDPPASPDPPGKSGDLARLPPPLAPRATTAPGRRPAWPRRGDRTLTVASMISRRGMESGDWAEPQPMATTSLRLPVEVINQLKQQARERHLRYTSYVRSILERAASGDTPPEIADITERLERIERAVTGGQSPGGQKTA